MARDLRAARGVGYDAVMSFAIHLDDALTSALRTRTDGPDTSLESRWRPTDAAAFTPLLQELVSDTRFDDFLKTQRPVYEAAEESFRTPVEQNVNLTMV